MIRIYLNIFKIELKYLLFSQSIQTMLHYLRRMFANQPANPRQLQRTVSGLDPKHIGSGNYIYKNFMKTKLSPALDSLKLLNIYGEGTLSRHPHQEPLNNKQFIDMLGGGLWPKTQHPPNQKPCCPSAPSKESNRLPSSQKN